MEEVKDFFKHLNVRLSSPLIFSFLISWLIFNWQVSIGFFFLYHKDDFSGFSKLLSDTLAKPYSFLAPIIFALTYTLFSPLLSLLIKALQTFFEKKSDQLNLWILDGSKIAIDKYLIMRESVMAKEKNLVEIITQESATREKLTKTQDYLHNVEIQKAELRDAMDKAQIELNRYDDLKKEIVVYDNLKEFFKGTWVNEFNIPINFKQDKAHIGLETFFIEDKTYVAHDKARFSIDSIRFIPFMKALAFHKQKLSEVHAVTAVYIIKVSEDLWCGYEKLPHGEISYVRYYSIEKMPSEYPIIVPKSELQNTQILVSCADILSKSLEALTVPSI